MTVYDDNRKQWFVMRDLRRANARETAYKLLMKAGYDAFTPMTTQKNKKTGKQELVPLFHWLLFLYASKTEIDTIVNPVNPVIPYLQYRYQRGKSAREGGMTVDEKSMAYFRIALSRQNFPLVYHYDDITPDMRGRRVMVIRGELMGYKGYLQKYSRGRNMRLFVELDRFCLTPVQISPEEIRFIDDDDNEVKLNRRNSKAEMERQYYAQLSRVTEIVNFLRFTVPSDFADMAPERIAEIREICLMARDIFNEFRLGDHLDTDALCNDRLRKIAALAPSIPDDTAVDNDSPLIARMRRLCRDARS